MANNQKTKRVSVARNTRTANEAAYWNFSQDELGVPKTAKDAQTTSKDLSLNWKKFSSQLIQSVKSHLANTISEFDFPKKF